MAALAGLLRSAGNSGDEQPVSDLVLRVIDEVDQRLLKECGDRFGMDVVAIDKFRRYGRSNTDLFLMSHHPHDTPRFVVKLGPIDDVSDEFERTRTSRVWVDNLRDPELVVSDEDGRAALCLPLIAKDGDNIIELDDKYQSALKGTPGAIDELVEGLDGAYAILARKSHTPSSESPSGSLGQYFDRYRRKKWTDRCGALFESAAALPPVRIQSQVVEANPLRFLEACFERAPRPMLAKWVHGDLHPSNVVFSNGEPAFVDFAWREKDDIACKDFVMMESAFRFMRFPRFIHPELLEQIDTAMNSSFDTSSAQAIVDALPEGPIRNALDAMTAAVSCVRKNAGVVLDRFDVDPVETENEYFTCLYLVLAGQQRFDTFPLIRVVGNLHQLAEWHVGTSE